MGNDEKKMEQATEQQIMKAIGPEQIKKAQETLKKYKNGKKSLEEKIVQNELWFRMRHWDVMKGEQNKNDPKPASGWLFNCIMSKHADFIDAYPEPNILPREEGDKLEAKQLSSIVPVILEQNNFEETYSDTSWYKLKNGTGCYGVFWDKSKLNGLGDISIQEIDLLNLFWEPGIKKLQKSRNLFYVNLMDNDILEDMYPQLKGKLSTDTSELKKYVHDDAISTEGKSLVVDWYYHKMVNQKKVLHYCKFCGNEVLFASENETKHPTRIVKKQGLDEQGNSVMQQVEEECGQSMAECGWYDHGLYPFVFDVLFKEEGLPTGFGYIDVCKEAQESIDRLNNDIEINARWGAKPRWFMREDGSINEEEYNDLSNSLVHVSGNLGEDTLRRIESEKLDGVYLNILQAKIEELKETSGNRDVNNGGSTSGVTAASAIAAMQEQSGKSSRDMIKASYRAYSSVIEMVIELIRQFYDWPRKFRIIGEKGQVEFTTYNNQGIKMQHQGVDFGNDMGYRLPVFDVKVSAQKANPYSKVSQNELAMEFFAKGFFNPQLADQALACVDMMDFDQKDAVIEKITANGTMYQQIIQMQQQMLQMAQIIDQMKGGNLAENMAMGMQGGVNIPMISGGKDRMVETDSIGNLKETENKVVEKARERASASTQPR